MPFRCGAEHGRSCPRRYYLGTFTKNNVTGGTATLTFDFNGTAIWIYGAKRTNHGTYSVQIDGATFSDLNGNANDLFQQSLFNTSTLSQEMHTVKLTNTATSTTDPYVDIDMVSHFSPRTLKYSMAHRLRGNPKLAIQATSWLSK